MTSAGVSDAPSPQDQSSDPRTRARRLAQAAEARLTSGNLVEAVSTSEEALDVLQGAFGPADPDTLVIRSQLARSLALLDRHEEAYTFLQENLALARRLERPDAIAGALNELADSLVQLGRHAEAIAFYEESLELSRRQDDRHRVAETLDRLAALYVVRDNRDDYLRAAQLQSEALAIFQALGDREREASSLYSLAHINERLGDFPRALELGEQSVAIAREINHPVEGYVLLQIAIIHERMGNARDALGAAEQALPALQRLGADWAVAQTYLLLAGIHNDLHAPDSATPLLFQALDLYDRLDGSTSERPLLDVARLLAEVGETDKSIELYDRLALSSDGDVAAAAATARAELSKGRLPDPTGPAQSAATPAGPSVEGVEGSILDLRARAVSDQPSLQDVLGFRPLVDGLEALLNDEETMLPLALAITAPWGAGKSSVMMQLQDRLEVPSGRRPRRRNWHVVTFEAWKYERSERLWAALAKKIYDQPQQKMSPWQRVGFRFRLERERQESWWFLLKGLGPPLFGAAAAVGVLATTKVSPEAAAPLLSIGSIGVFLASAGTFWGLVSNPFKRAIERYASRPRYQDQLGFTTDAEKDINALTKTLLRDQDSALAVFVDDLDRCNYLHVVEVVEAINQIFNSNSTPDRRCVFVLGMDRQVVAASIEVAYQNTIRYLQERRSSLADGFGMSFLAKIMQLSVAIPEPDDLAVRRLLAQVTGQDVATEDAGAVPEHVVERYKEGIERQEPSNPADVHRIGRGMEVHDEVERLAREEAIRRKRADLFTKDSVDVAAAEFETVHYLGRNPRQIKRFDNAFRLQLHVANGTPGSKLDFSRDQLVALGKWVAVRMRWPELAQAIDDEPRLLLALERHANRGAAGSFAAVTDSHGQLKEQYPVWFSSRELEEVLRDSNPKRLLSALPLDSFLRVA